MRIFIVAGSIPPELGNLQAVKRIELSNNELTGTLTIHFGAANRTVYGYMCFVVVKQCDTIKERREMGFVRTEGLDQSDRQYATASVTV